MDKLVFEKIKSVLEKRVELCRTNLDKIKSPEDLSNITLLDLHNLRNFCKKEEGIQTRILQIDLYHILGMGKLTVVQTNIVLHLIRIYGTYRTDIHRFASWNGNIDTIPEIPKISSFKLREFDVQLTNGRGGEIVEVEETTLNEIGANSESQNVDEVQEESQIEPVCELEPVGLYNVVKHYVQFNLEDSTNLVDMIVRISPWTNGNTSSILKKLQNQETYANALKFTKVNDNIYRMEVRSPNHLKIFKQLYTNHFTA